MSKKLDVNENLRGSNSTTNTQSEFYLDLLQVFGDSNNNAIHNEPPKSSNPTIIRPTVAPRTTSLKNNKPSAPAIPSKSLSAVPSTRPITTSRKKKVPPPRPAPPKIKKAVPVSYTSSKVPPSYSKVLEEDIRACIDAYSTSTKSNSKTIYGSTNNSNNTSLHTSSLTMNSKSNSISKNLIQLNTPERPKKGPFAVKVNETTVTSKNLKQAGAAASFLNKNPKLTKMLVPKEHQSTVKFAGKAYDFREEHKDKVRPMKSNKPVDLLGSLKNVDYPQKQSKLHQLQKVDKKNTKTAPVSIDLNAAWGADAFASSSTLNENKVTTPTSPIVPEPKHPPPVCLNADDSLPNIEPQGVALFNYTACKVDEISFKTKDIIKLLNEAGDRFYGRLGSQEGFFPKFCVDVLIPLSSGNEEVVVSDDYGYKEEIPGVASCKTDNASQVMNNCQGKFYTALYDYTGEPNSGDISFQTGDRITVHSIVDSNWLVGECNGQVGQFPAAFIDFDPSDLPVELPPFISKTSALYDFDGSAADELSFKKDDVICITEIIDDQWHRGYVCSNPNFIGLLPASFVGESEPAELPKVRALYQFDASSADELSFKIDDEISILETVNQDWMKGRIGGNEGLFPSSFVTNAS